MPRYEVRLEDPNSDHVRITRLDADNAEAAKAWCQRREYKTAAFQLDDAELARIEKAEAKLKDGQRLPAQDRGVIAVHRQETPYDVVSVKEV